MERYDEYKDSGVEWIGEIPAGWEIGRFGKAGISSLGKMLANNPDADDSFLAPYLKAANVQESGFELGDIAEMYFNSHDEGRYRIKRGDLLVVEGGSVGVSQIWDGSIEPCYIQNALHRVRPSEGFEARYLKFCLDLARYSGYVDLICNKATIAHFTKEKLSATPIPIPSFCEQKAIADYLESETAEISSVIADCEREVELLQEYRKAVISEAVTKGLDPNVPMKDSDIEWIGEIPETWSMDNLGMHSSMVTPMRDKPEDLSGPIPWVRIEDYDGKYISASKDGLGVSMDTVKAMNLKIYPVGTLLCTSSCDLGKCAIVAKELVSNQRFIGIIPIDYDIDYLYYLMLSNAERLNFLSTGTIQANLSRKAFEHLRLPYPLQEEQQVISTYLDEKTADIDALIADYQSMADKLREYRKSLISEAVTGKFKVPGV